MGVKTLKHEPITKSRIRYKLASSKPTLPVLFLLRHLSPFYQRFIRKFISIQICNSADMVNVWSNFQNKQTKLIIAFRHPYGDEPMLLSHVFASILPREARRLKKPLQRRPHARFIHGYEVALWGDSVIRWVLPRIGAVPVYHIKIDTASIRTIRNIIINDTCPLALAPEGQVSYRSETVPRLEQGTAQMGFWCAEELKKENRTEHVVILPLSVHYQFDPRDTKKLVGLIEKTETACGLEITASRKLSLIDRLVALDWKILSLTEEHYKKTYAYQVPIFETGNRQLRWNALMECALDLAEKAMGLVHKQDNLIERVYRIRQEGWDRIYPENDETTHCALETALTHRRAGEAWYAMRHMEFVDLAFYLDSDYQKGISGEGPSFDRLVETAYNLADLIERLSGGNITNRPNIMRKKAFIISGSIIDISDRLDDYKVDRKKAVKSATEELQQSFLNCIKEYLNE